MSNFSARIPLLRLLIPFIIGIIACYSFRFSLHPGIFLALVSICIFVLIAYKKLVKRSLNWRGFDGIIISFALFLSGCGICSQHLEKSVSASPGKQETNALLVTLLNDPIVKERSVKLFVEVTAQKDAGWNATKEKMLVYLQRDPAAEKLKYGDELLMHSKPAEVEAPKNPDEFDYKSWLERKGVHQQVYGKSGEWKLISGGHGNFFKSQALDLRRYFLENLKSYGFSPSAFGVAAALLLGASDHLDPGTIQSYSASGTLHVLSVSGMHVALVYIVLLKLLAPLERRRFKWLSILLQLLFLWFYATLTGLCPSVLRSVTMLSVIIAGRAFNRNAHILNSLSASALILLLLDPLLIFDIGFQLSYLAVGGIVLLQPKLEGLWEPDTNSFKGKILKHGWTLISVTLVAQVFTFPLGLYYFQQFPLYFILSNLVIIPLSTIVMYAGLILLLVSPIVILAKPIALLFGFLVELLNACVGSIEHLPNAVLHSAKWETTELLLMYLCISFLLIFLIRKRRSFLRFGMAAFSLMLVLVACESHKNLHDRKIVFFNVNRASVIAVVNGNDMVLLTDTTLLKRKGDIDFHVEPFLKARGIEEDNFVSITDSLVLKNDFLRYGKSRLHAFGKKIVLIDQHFHSTLTATDEIVLLRNNTFVNLEKLIAQSKPKLVIADGSSGRKMIAKWKAVCEKSKVEFYDVTEAGALVMGE